MGCLRTPLFFAEGFAPPEASFIAYLLVATTKQVALSKSEKLIYKKLNDTLSQMPKLTIKNLHVNHVGPINLGINAGEIVCLSGASGSGKSLLCRAIADLIPHTGDVRLDDEEAHSMPAPVWRRKVALLPAESQWWYDRIGEHFTHKDDVLLQRLGFTSLTWDWDVVRCSTGEKQRLAFLRVLVNQPLCLLLDEPTASLDEENTRLVEDIVCEYALRHDVAVLWVSHSAAQIKRIANRHYMIRNGQLEFA